MDAEPLPLPPDVIDGHHVSTDTLARVMVAVVRLYTPGWPLTVRDIAEQAGVAVGHTHWALRALRDHQLVAWEPGRAGTLRPTVKVV